MKLDISIIHFFKSPSLIGCICGLKFQ